MVHPELSYVLNETPRVYNTRTYLSYTNDVCAAHTVFIYFRFYFFIFFSPYPVFSHYLCAHCLAAGVCAAILLQRAVRHAHLHSAAHSYAHPNDILTTIIIIIIEQQQTAVAVMMMMIIIITRDGAHAPDNVTILLSDVRFIVNML